MVAWRMTNQADWRQQREGRMRTVEEFSEQDEYVTVEELANVLKVNVRTIQRIVQRKELPAIRVGRQWRFRREWVTQWLGKNTVNLGEGSA